MIYLTRCGAPPQVTTKNWDDIPEVHQRLITEKLGNMGCDGTFVPGPYCGTCIYAEPGMATEDDVLSADFEASIWQTNEDRFKDTYGATESPDS